MPSRRLAPVLTAALALAAAAPAAATAAAPPAGPVATAAAARPATLAVRVRVDRIRAHAARATAEGVATATLTNFSGERATVRQHVTLSAATATSCRVLHLTLDTLQLQLLGLNAHLDRVQLDITGRRHGGVLGQLFCRLSRGLSGGKAKARAAAVRAIDARLRRHPMPAMRFTARLTPQATASQAPAATCQVLDLVLGPLDLDLLGLVVDLNRVHLNVTATRGGGVLGDLFCSLADGKPQAPAA